MIASPFRTKSTITLSLSGWRNARELEKQQLEKQQSKNDAQQVDKSHDEEKELKKLKRARISIQTATLQFIDEIDGLGGGFSAFSGSER